MSWFHNLAEFINRHGLLTLKPAAPRLSALEQGNRVARQIEINNPEVVIAGVRQVSEWGHRSWIIDVVNRETGRMVSIEEYDHWSQRLLEILPFRSLDDARLARPPRPVAPTRGEGRRLS